MMLLLVMEEVKMYVFGDGDSGTRSVCEDGSDFFMAKCKSMNVCLWCS